VKKRMLSLLLELLRDSKRSDRELAKVLGRVAADCEQDEK